MDFSIIVLDDEIMIGKTVGRVLSENKIYVTTKIDDMRTYMENNEVSLLIIDYELHQELTGIEVASEMKHLYPLLQIILFTGNTDYTIIKDALNSGAISSFMNKPISSKELKKLVDENKKIWESNQEQLQNTLDKIKSGMISDLDFSQFGNQLPILNLLVKESIKIKDSHSSQLIGASISKDGVKIFQEFTKNEMVIHDDMLFMGFIATVNKMAQRMFLNSKKTINVVNLKSIDLINQQIDNTSYTVFMTKYNNNKAFNEMISNLVNDLHNKLISSSFEVSEQIHSEIMMFLEKFNNSLVSF